MNIKAQIKNGIKRHADSIYKLGLQGELPTFDEWIREKESDLARFDMSVDGESIPATGNEPSYATEYEGVTIRIIPYSKVDASFKITNYIEDLLVFVNGELTDKAIPILVDKFKRQSQVSIWYGDEDIADSDVAFSGRYGSSVEGSRRNPYFKPDWSPNAFLDHFYFCNMVAIKRHVFRDEEWDTALGGARTVYNTLLKFIFKNEVNLRRSVEHIDAILVHAKEYELNRLTDVDSSAIVDHMSVVGKNVKIKISVVIPSKDNPLLIKKCLESLKATTGRSVEYETIIVDNGSSEENRKLYEAMAPTLDFSYIYASSEFNFSKMINLGVSKAKHDFVLLLNDDITFAGQNALFTLTNQAKLSFTGAVGLKLLYPDSNRIQHAGVINNQIGPVHKLQFLDDTIEYYHGFNKSIQNVSAVTAACVLVRKSVFEEVRGLDEGLKVAFNDVDFCYKLVEHGYVNVVCNNIYAIHEESITRGKDSSTEKLIRLEAEKKLLYSMHPAFKGFDPYFSKNLLSECLDVRIVPANEYEYERACEYVYAMQRLNKNDPASIGREEPCVQLSLEFAGEFEDFTYRKADASKLYLQGFAYVAGSDNAFYKKSLLLFSDNAAYKIPVRGCVRNDVAIACADQENVERSGFSVAFPRDKIKEGTYRVGVLFENKYAKEKLYVFSNKLMVVN